MARAPATHACSGEEKLEVGLKKGPWTPDEDQKLVAYIQKHGHGSWRSLPVNAGLQRCGKSCRLRWTNYLRPDIKRGRFSQDEDQMIVHLHAILGNRWSAIASHLPRRTDNEIKNYWNTHLKKRLVQMGIDPVTHKSTASEELVLHSIIPGLRPVVSSNLTHMSQWDCARAEAEARLSLSRQCSLSGSGCSSLDFQGPSQTTPPRGSSTSFMSTWKEQVAETLRPSFGFVELDKVPAHPVNLQTFLQDWESSLQAGPLQGSSHVKRTFDSGTSLPSSTDTSATSAVRLSASSCEFLTPPARNSATPLFSLSPDSQGSSSFSFSGMCESGTTMTTLRQSFSPTSTLHAPDYDSSYTNSPCVSSTEPSCNFDGLLTTQTTTSSFPLLNFQDQPGSTFWCRQQVAMVDALQQPEPASYFLPNNIPIPHFDSLC